MDVWRFHQLEADWELQVSSTEPEHMTYATGQNPYYVIMTLHTSLPQLTMHRLRSLCIYNLEIADSPYFTLKFGLSVPSNVLTLLKRFYLWHLGLNISRCLWCTLKSGHCSRADMTHLLSNVSTVYSWTKPNNLGQDCLCFHSLLSQFGSALISSCRKPILGPNWECNRAKLV